jgi:hypothetical protein
MAGARPGDAGIEAGRARVYDRRGRPMGVVSLAAGEVWGWECDHCDDGRDCPQLATFGEAIQELLVHVVGCPAVVVDGGPS